MKRDLLLSTEAKKLTALCRRHRWAWKVRENDAGGYAFSVFAKGDPRHTYWRGTVYGSLEDAVRQVRMDLGEVEPPPSREPAVAHSPSPARRTARQGGRFVASVSYVVTGRRNEEIGEYKTLAAAKAAAREANYSRSALKWKKVNDDYYSDGDFNIVTRGA